MQQPTLIPLALCSTPIKMLYNLPSGIRFSSQPMHLLILAENKDFISKPLVSLLGFCPEPNW